MRLLAPLSLVYLCWLLTAVAAFLALNSPDRFDLLPVFMGREELTLVAFGWYGAAWIGVALIVYALGDLVARMAGLGTSTSQSQVDLNRAARLTFWVNLGLIGVTLLWIVSSASKVGGVTALVTIAYLDSLGTRELLLENKLFTGMRLFYAALPATGCMAAAILATGRRDLNPSRRRLCWLVLGINTVALTVLPIVMSQRLLLLQFLLSAYLVSCLIKGRIFGLPWLLLSVVLFLGTWILREAVTNPHFDQSPVDIGIQKLVFYFVNDMWNAFAPLQSEIAHTFGTVSLKGLMFFTFTDGIFAQIMAEQLDALDAVLGGGDFPFLTAAFVDFGPFGGAIFIALCAFVFRSVFHKAQSNLCWAAIYAQLGSALLFSSHGIYFTHQNFLFSLIVIFGVFRLARASESRSGLAQIAFASRRGKVLAHG